MKRTLKAFYNLIPFKAAVYAVVKKVWTPPEKIFRHLHFKGVFTAKVGRSGNLRINHFGFRIENEVFWRGLTNSWEKQSLSCWIKLCAEAETIVDIGANTGLYSLVAKTINPGAKIYAFEPHPRFFNYLVKNIALNRFDVIPHEKAVSNFNGNLDIEDYTAENPTIAITAITLDSFVEQYGIERIDLLKIDVEMHEPQVLEGFSRYLSLFRPTMLIEILTDEIATAVFDRVKDLGYLYFNIDENGGIRQTSTIEKSDYYNYLLCSPETAAKIGLKKSRNFVATSFN